MSAHRRMQARLSIALLIGASATIATRADVTNGDFGAGNTGFTSGYAYTTGSDPGGGHYTIGSNPHTFNSGAGASYGDHTTGTGLMLIADAALTANVPVWSESVPVTPNTQYAFSYYAASWGNDAGNGKDPSPATLIATANGSQIGSTFTVTATDGVWTQFTAVFNSGSLTLIPLSITDSNLVSAGNDFSLDDVAVTQAPEPTGFAALIAGAASLLLRRRPARR